MYVCVYVLKDREREKETKSQTPVGRGNLDVCVTHMQLLVLFPFSSVGPHHVACGIVPDQRWSWPLHWERGVLTTGPENFTLHPELIGCFLTNAEETVMLAD